MQTWDVGKYKYVVNSIKIDKIFNGKPIKSKEEIYEELAKMIFSNKETVKSWTRPSSKGPGDESMRLDLEKALGLQKDALVTCVEQKEDIMEVNANMTDFNKNAIYDCYELMKNYLHDHEMESEECFSQMWAEVEKYKIAIPEELYKKISDFIDENLAPIVYEYEETYKECHTEDIGSFNEEGVFVIKDEEGTKKMMMAFMLKNIEIENKLDEFAREYLQPYLV